jgi:hypothetical protein
MRRGRFPQRIKRGSPWLPIGRCPALVAADHATGARARPLRIDCSATARRVPPPVLAPLHDIPRYVRQAPRIGQLPPYGMGRCAAVVSTPRVLGRFVQPGSSPRLHRVEVHGQTRVWNQGVKPGLAGAVWHLWTRGAKPKISLVFGREWSMFQSMDSSLPRAPSLEVRQSALGLLRTKAAQGDAQAQYDLGTHCHRASCDALRKDTIESRIEAYKWFHLAAGQRFKDALTSCQRVTLAMSHAEFDEGNRRAAAFATGQPSLLHTP